MTTQKRRGTGENSSQSNQYGDITEQKEKVKFNGVTTQPEL